MKLFFRKLGEGKPLIILHGLFGMSDNWMSLAKQFSENGFKVFLPDARNHGQSLHSSEFNYQLMNDDLLELMNDENISSTNLIGHSMGGKTAMLFSKQHPERIEKLIVVDISPVQYSSANENVLKGIRAVDLSKVNSRKEVEEQMKNKIPDAVVRQFLLKNLFWKDEGDEKKLAWRFNLDAIKNNLHETGIELSEENILSTGTKFCAPTIFIRGEKSDYIKSEDEPIIKKYFPNSTLKTIAGAGHWVHADKPKEFFETAINFLK